MAKELNYTTPDGVNHPKSYWRPVQVNLNYNGSGNITFLGYHDQLSSDSGKEPIGSKIYGVDSNQFDQYYALDKFVNGVDLLSQSYALAVATKDVDLDAQRENGRSFFEGARDV